MVINHLLNGMILQVGTHFLLWTAALAALTHPDLENHLGNMAPRSRWTTSGVHETVENPLGWVVFTWWDLVVGSPIFRACVFSKTQRICQPWNFGDYMFNIGKTMFYFYFLMVLWLSDFLILTSNPDKSFMHEPVGLMSCLFVFCGLLGFLGGIECPSSNQRWKFVFCHEKFIHFSLPWWWQNHGSLVRNDGWTDSVHSCRSIERKMRPSNILEGVNASWLWSMLRLKMNILAF